MVTRTFYTHLIENGVKIYEYTIGFIHSKTFVCDDKIGVVGSINMDYRSLYLHFECGVFMYQTSSILEIKNDFLEILEICTPITSDYTKNAKFSTKIIRSILKVLAPLM